MKKTIVINERTYSNQAKFGGADITIHNVSVTNTAIVFKYADGKWGQTKISNSKLKLKKT
jgi:hypothetical protein